MRFKAIKIIAVLLIMAALWLPIAVSAQTAPPCDDEYKVKKYKAKAHEKI